MKRALFLLSLSCIFSFAWSMKRPYETMINQQCALNMHMLLKVVDQEIDLLPPENSGITETKTFTSKGAFACNQCIFKTNQEMRLQSHTKVHEVLKHYPHKKS
jgi:hypothetical protein